LLDLDAKGMLEGRPDCEARTFDGPGSRSLQQFARPQTLTTLPVTVVGFAEQKLEVGEQYSDLGEPTWATWPVVAFGRAHNAWND